MNIRAVAVSLLSLFLVWWPYSALAEPGSDRWQLAVKYSTIEFVGDKAETQQIERGSYGALEAYLQVAPGTYLGGEIGGTSIENGSVVILGGSIWEADFEFLSMEMNLKYALPLGARLAAEAGIGVALIEAGNVPRYFSGSGYTQTYYGGQAFFGVNLVGEHWYCGGHTKYQEVEAGYSNWRTGAQLGYRFN